MVLYRYWTGLDTIIIIIIIIWMYTSILGNKQSTINRYMYFFPFFLFPFHIQKGFGRHTLSSSTIIKLVHDSNASLPWIDSLLVNRQRTDSDAKPERNKRKRKKGGPLALLGFLSSYKTNSLLLLFNIERSLKVVRFHIRISAGWVWSQSAGDIWSNGETQQPH